MIFENLTVNRVAVHEVFQRRDDRSLPPPAYGDALEQLDTEAITILRLRMTEALSTKSLQMRIARYGHDSFLAAADNMIVADDKAFLTASQSLATKLAEAQIQRRIPGGMLIVFDGVVGAPSVPFIGVIKAETQAGFRRSNSGGRAVIELLRNVFLTPATRLYKIGVMLRDNDNAVKPDGWRAFVFDSNISANNREAAAAYFYDGFLGCALPSDGPYETMRFFDLTKDFVRAADIDGEKKRDIIDSLHVFVRDEQSPTFTAQEFGERYLPTDLHDTFLGYLDNKHFTPNAVVRDISQMGSRLRRRRFRFGSDVELVASSEALRQKVTISAIDGEPMNGETPEWTQIIIRQRMTGEQ